MTARELVAELEEDKLERLKWLVLREFGFLPGSAAARELSDEDYLRCGAHLLLDLRQGHAGNRPEEGESSSFDPEQFSRLSEGRA